MSSKTLPLVSITVPTYGQAKYLPMTLDAIWFQDYPNIEIIVVNANSPDNTKEVLSAFAEAIDSETINYAKRFDREKNEVIRQSELRYPKTGRSLTIVNLDADPGLSETYNVGLRKSNGMYIAAIVSDDLPHTSMVSELVLALESGADFAYGDMFWVDDAGRIRRQMKFPEYDPTTCLADWYLMGSARMWRKKLHDTVGYMDPAYRSAHDYDLILRFAMSGAQFKHVPKTLYSVRLHGSERPTGNHTIEREPLVYSESKQIALRAEKWLNARK